MRTDPGFHLSIRVMPAIIWRQSVPASIQTVEGAIAHACDVAASLRRKVCLHISSERWVWLSENGVIENETAALTFP